MKRNKQSTRAMRRRGTVSKAPGESRYALKVKSGDQKYGCGRQKAFKPFTSIPA